MAVVALSDTLIEKIDLEVFEFIVGSLSESPQWVGESLRAPLAPAFLSRRVFYRVLYPIDEAAPIVKVSAVAREGDARRRCLRINRAVRSRREDLLEVRGLYRLVP
jgi:hypothetical protein